MEEGGDEYRLSSRKIETQSKCKKRIGAHNLILILFFFSRADSRKTQYLIERTRSKGERGMIIRRKTRAEEGGEEEEDDDD
jgi:hypothetical protein